MMTPKMKEDFCTRILEASRQLFLSSRIFEVCLDKGTQKQLEFCPTYFFTLFVLILLLIYFAVG